MVFRRAACAFLRLIRRNAETPVEVERGVNTGLPNDKRQWGAGQGQESIVNLIFDRSLRADD